MIYNILRASFIKASTEASGFCLRILSNAFSMAVLLKPKIVNADNASARIVLFGTLKISVCTSIFFSLSFRSMTMRWAVFVPMPFTL